MLFSMFSTRLVPRLLARAPLLRNVAIPLAARRVVVASPFSTSIIAHQPAAATSIAARKSSTTKKSDASPVKRKKAGSTSTKAGTKKSVRKPAPKKRTVKKVKVGARVTKKKVAAKKGMSQDPSAWLTLIILSMVEIYKLTKQDKPPTRPQNSYTLFCSRFLRAAHESDDAQKSMENTRNLVKSAAATWRGLSEHEKQVRAEIANISIIRSTCSYTMPL